MPPDFAAVLERLGRLERQNDRLHRQNRRLKWAGAVGAVLLTTLGLSSCTSRSQGPTIQDPVKGIKKGQVRFGDQKGVRALWTITILVTPSGFRHFVAGRRPRW